MTNNTEIKSLLINKLLKLVDTWNIIYTEYSKNKIYDDKDDILKNTNNILFIEDISENSDDEYYYDSICEYYCNHSKTTPFDIQSNYENIIKKIGNIICDDNKYLAYIYYNKLYLKIINSLITEILENTPKADITITEFTNIKTELYPYQIKNWMLNIENINYTEECSDIKKKLLFKGGGLFDEVGMGKTLQMITLINKNKSKIKSMVKNKNNKVYTKATLVITPSHLCGQWLREFDIHLNKSLNIISLLTKRHYDKYTYYDFIKADVIIVSANFFYNCKINQHEEIDPLFNVINIFNKNVNLFKLYWHRIVLDEYHEFENSVLFEKLKYIESDYRWIISGTPFKENKLSSYHEIESTSLSIICDYLNSSTNIINTVDITDINVYYYIKNHFSRNSHNKNIKILKLPVIKEEIVWLNFTETERMIYNAYLVDPNNTPYDTFLRQICCHPLLSEKLRENMSNQLESLSEMRDHIKKMYFKDYDDALFNHIVCEDRIKKIEKNMADMEKEKKENLLGYKNLKDELTKVKDKLTELTKIKDGKESSLLYYKRFLELISDMKNVVETSCPICMDNINENNLGITICGHIYCYSCISVVIKEARKRSSQSKCPNCNKNIGFNDVFMISKNKSKDVDTLGTKLAYIINYIKATPSKYRIIFSQWDYLLKEVGKVLLENNIKHLYCQGIVYQKDKVLRLFNSPDSENNEYKIIMLSSDSTVSGSNLNNAEEVIFLDPVYGDMQYRINTENQAIGRVRRLGNKFKEIKVLRLLIKDSIEEEIYNKTDIYNK
jgi:SNF2 family DNA or RNA helicase